jgi:hypothetical protein
MSSMTKKANKLFITSTIKGETLTQALPYLENKGAIKDEKGNDIYRMSVVRDEYGNINTNGVIFNAVDKDGFATAVINIDVDMTPEDIAREYGPAKVVLDKAEEVIVNEISQLNTTIENIASEISIE